MGAKVAEVDAFDAKAVEQALSHAEADIVIDQLTALPKDPADMAAAAAGDRRLRLEGGGYLYRAASGSASVAICNNQADSSSSLGQGWRTKPKAWQLMPLPVSLPWSNLHGT